MRRTCQVRPPNDVCEVLGAVFGAAGGTLGALVALPFVSPLGLLYWPGVALIAAILVYEHWIVRPDDLSRVDQAFFQLNGYVSLAFFGVVLVAL